MLFASHRAQFASKPSSTRQAMRPKVSKLLLSMAAILGSSLLAPVALAAPKNVIYMIGDGMGPAYLAAYRYYMDDTTTKAVEPTIYDELWVGVATTYPDDDTIVTDSAAGATALATTFKSYNGAISVDKNHNHLKTMLEIAKAAGKKTGIVATAQINHATPASFMAHNKTRKAYDEIADDYVDNKVQGKFVADLMFGGGTKYFTRKDRHLVNEFKAAGWHYADSWQHLDQLNKLPAMALLAPVGFPSALDNPKAEPLATMTSKALSLLSNDNQKGFVVMIEGSQIDWCGHANDIACAMAEMHDFAQAIKVAKAYVDKNPDTVLVITADHETGGLSLGAAGDYAWKRDVIKAVKHTAPVLARMLIQERDDKLEQLWQEQTGLSLTPVEWQQILTARQQAKAIYDKLDAATKQDPEAESDALAVLATPIKQLISQYSRTGWTSGGHTAIDVPVLAYGKEKQQFAGFQDNTDIARKLINFIMPPMK